MKLNVNDFQIKDNGKEIYSFAKKIFPICRSITGNGVRETLTLIKKEIPNLKIHEIKSGTKVFDWTIPEEWNISDAFIISPDNKKIVDFKKNNLHILNYSIPVNLKLKLEDLKKHLYFDEEIKDAIPYVTSYYKKNWGFCLSYNQYKKLKKGIYKIVIKSSLKKGSLTYADMLIKGKSKKEILLTSYTCHPSMGNNEVSGPSLFNFFS